MPQGPDLSKAIRTMRKDIDRARKGGPAEEYVSPAPVFAAPSQKPGANFASPNPAFAQKEENAPSGQTQQMQKLAEEKQRMEKLRIEEQKRKEAEELIRKQEEEKARKLEEQKKEEERMKKEAEEKKKEEERLAKENEERKKREKEEEKKKLREYFINEDLTAKKKAVLDMRRKLDQDKSGLNAELKKISDLKRPLENEKNAITKRINDLKETRDQLAKKESEIENEKIIIDEKILSSSSDEEKKKLENERWKIGDRRRDAEKKRWAAEENIASLEAKMEEFDLKYWPMKEREEDVRSQIAGFESRENDLKEKAREVELKEGLKKFEETKKVIEKKASQFEAKAGELAKKLEAILSNEALAENEEKLVEEKEKSASDFRQRKEIEEKRWVIERQRRDMEKQKWQVLSEKKEVDSELARASKMLNDLSAKTEAAFEELARMEEALGDKGFFGRKKEAEKPAEPVKIEKKPEVEIKKEPPPEIKKEEEEIVLPEAKMSEKEAGKKIEESKEKEPEEEGAGVEIITPVKDYGPQKEAAFEKVLREPVEIEESIKPEPQIPPAMPEPAKQEKPRPSILDTHPLPKKPGIGRKIFARVLTISLLSALIFFNVTFWYWYIFERVKSETVVVAPTPTPTPIPECVSNEDCGQGEMCTKEGKCVNKPITILGPMVSVSEEERFKISDYADIPGIMLSVISDWPNKDGYALGKFKRIIIINEKESRQATIKEIFDSLLVSAPGGFYDRLGENYTLFAHSQKEGVRIGLVSSTIDTDNFKQLLTQSEGTMKDGFRSFFSLMSLESPVTTKLFSSALKVKGYSGPDFRFLPVAKNDLGICYAVYNGNFVLTTSFESIKKVLEDLKNRQTASPGPTAAPSQ